MVSDQWATYADAARIVRVRPGTIRVWVCRGKVRIDVQGKRVFVHLSDVRHAEREWRDRMTRAL